MFKHVRSRVGRPLCAHSGGERDLAGVSPTPMLMSVWNQAAGRSKANKQGRVVERKVCFISDAGNWGTGGWQTSVQRLTPPTPQQALMYFGAPVLFVLCTAVLLCCLSYVLRCSCVVLVLCTAVLLCRACLRYCGAPVLFVLCTAVLPCCLSYVLWCSRVVCLMYCGAPVSCLS